MNALVKFQNLLRRIGDITVNLSLQGGDFNIKKDLHCAHGVIMGLQ